MFLKFSTCFVNSLIKIFNSLIKRVPIICFILYLFYVIIIKNFNGDNMTEEEIKNNFSKNLVTLRKSKRLTQLALAEKLNYSDKAVSKWEVGSVLPDVDTMVGIADFFGVTVNDLIYEKKRRIDIGFFKSHIFTTLVAMCAVFFLASIIFCILGPGLHILGSWLAFIYAIPVSSILFVVFSALWFGRKWLYLAVTILFWGVLLTIYLTIILYGYNLWFLFIVGVFGQIVVTFSFMISYFGKKNK